MRTSADGKKTSGMPKVSFECVDSLLDTNENSTAEPHLKQLGYFC